MTEDFHEPMDPGDPRGPAEPDRTDDRTDDRTGEQIEQLEPDAGLTGHAQVDEVLRSLDGLDGRPVTEHVAVFEAAHEALRSALSDAARPSQRG
ncbi:MAG: hypothetical protein ACRDPR_05425 [Nocardioidaceae bacterium]